MPGRGLPAPYRQTLKYRSTMGAPDMSQASTLGPARRRGLLARLPDDVIADLVSISQRIEYPEGSIGFQWDAEPKTAILLRGSARTYLHTPEGAQITTRYLGPGDVTGTFAERTPRLARGLQTLEPTELLIAGGKRVQELAASHPVLAWALIEELTTVLNASHRALYLRAVGTVRQRVAVTLLDRGLIAGMRLGAGFRVEGTQQELAICAGTAREVTTLVLRSLQKEGIIEVHRGEVLITDPGRLIREANDFIGTPAPD